MAEELNATENIVTDFNGPNLAIITGWGGTQRPPKIIGEARALAFLTARRVSRPEALEIGLVTQIHDQVLQSALALAVTVHKKKAPSRSPAPVNT